MERAGDLLRARTVAVNTLVAIQIAYLFNVRYVHGTSLTWQGLLGTPAVLLGVGTVAGSTARLHLPAVHEPHF